MSPRASGKPRIRLAQPSLGVREERACLRVLRSGRLVHGPEGEAFEAEFAARVGARHAVAVSSGTAALQLALMALGVGPGHEVVVPAYTFIATANAVRWVGAEVVLVDVEPAGLNLDPVSLKRALGSRTRAVLPVHQFGLPADLEGIAAGAGRRFLLEDAACAAGARGSAGPIGQPRGVLACFSFHPRKVFTTGEGGMITTGDARLARRLRALRQHGLGEDGSQEIGSNFRLSELAAALGRVQLRRLDALLARRRRAAGWYAEGLADLNWLQLPPDTPGRVWQSYVVRLRRGAPLARAALLAGLQRQGIECQAGVAPVHHHRSYRRARRMALPVSEAAGRDAFFLPLHAELSADDVAAVCRALHRVASRGLKSRGRTR